jgi:hypothetical protein
MLTPIMNYRDRSETRSDALIEYSPENTFPRPKQGFGFFLSIFFLLLISVGPVWGGESHVTYEKTEADTASLREYAVKVFLDVPRRFHEYIKTEIPFVNYVRDSRQAQIHILMTTQRTGSNGREYAIAFFGQEAFCGVNDTLMYVSRQMDTEEMTRNGIARVIRHGLVRYVARTPLADMLSIRFKRDIHPTDVHDPWNNWVFSTGFETNLRGEEATSRLNLEASVTADRITPDWKVSFYGRSQYYRNRYDLEDGVFTSISRSHRFRGLVVRSLSDHWSFGVNVSANHSTYSNTDVSLYSAPAVEYNIFPYDESTRRQFRFIYRMGYTRIRYLEETIYSKMEEDLVSQSLSSTFEMKEKWGSVSTTLAGSHYFHDLSKNRLTLYSYLSIRLFEGFSFNVHGRASMIHDQLSLPHEGASEEEILLSRKQLATQYNYSVSMGFRFTFGSIYNNVVNPRFGN